MRERLYRSRQEKMIAGVAGGLAQYFDIDPVIVRVIFIAATLITGGLGLLAYVLLWIVVPYKDEAYSTAAFSTATEPPTGDAPAGEPVQSEPVNTYGPPREKRGQIAGYILIAIGFLFLADRFIPHFDASEFWPLLIIALGVGLLLKGSKK